MTRRSGPPASCRSWGGRPTASKYQGRSSSAPANALAALCACLKLCFLELLQPAARDVVIEDLNTAHRRALDEAQAALTGCPCRRALVRRCLAREVERWEAELVWLEALASELESARPLRP